NTSASTSCTVCRHDRSLLDVLGRPTSQVLVNDPEGSTTTATTYDSSGRVSTVSNPYRSTSDPTYGLETPTYDGLGRSTQVKHADESDTQLLLRSALPRHSGHNARIRSYKFLLHHHHRWFHALQRRSERSLFAKGCEEHHHDLCL